MVHPERQGGFTLLEILVALLIFSVGMLAVARLQIVTTQSVAGVRRTITATALAEDKIEQLKSLGFDALTNGVTNDPSNPWYDIFNRSWEITDFNGTTMKQITVTVTWTDAQGTFSIPLSTVISSAVQ